MTAFLTSFPVEESAMYGANNRIAHSRVVEAVASEFAGVAGALSRKSGSSWSNLKEDVTTLSNSLLTCTDCTRQWQIDICKESILPYLSSMISSTRFSLDAKRFAQLQLLLAALTPRPQLTLQDQQQHPSVALLVCESVLVEIQSENSFFGSELGVSLERAINKQWLPLVGEHQRMLRDVGSKLLILGLLESVYRPLLLCPPMFMIAQELIVLSKELNLVNSSSNYNNNNNNNNNNNHTASPIVVARKALQVVRIMAITYALHQLVTLLSVFAGVGQVCLLIGIVALALSTSPLTQSLKQAMPVLAPNMALISLLLERCSHLQDDFLQTLGSSPLFGTVRSTNGVNLVAHPQDEELVPAVAQLVQENDQGHDGEELVAAQVASSSSSVLRRRR